MKCTNTKLKKILEEHLPETGFPEGYGALMQEIDREMCRYDKQVSELENLDLLQQLEDANENLREFAHIVSHDLKAPLRGIRSIGRWLKTDYEERLDEEGKELLQLLDQRTSRMQQLIDGIMTFAKVSHSSEQIIEIQLSPFLEDLIEGLDVPSHIKIDIQDDLPKVNFELTQLTQVFQNLLSNAVKYMDKPEGRIKVEAKSKPSFWEICVSDNGPGIEKTYHEKIFQIFETLESRDKIDSSGVGLSIVKKIIDKVGGELWVESEVGKGSSFFFQVPKNIEEAIPNESYAKWQA